MIQVRFKELTHLARILALEASSTNILTVYSFGKCCTEGVMFAELVAVSESARLA